MRSRLIGVAIALVGSIGWRTDGTGKYADVTPPVNWSAKSNIVWKTPMPSWSNATPVVVGDRIFVCAEPSDLLCVSRKDGSILWKRSNSYEQLVPPAEVAEVRAMIASADKLSNQIGGRRKAAGTLKKKLRAAPDDAQLKKKLEDIQAEIKELQEQFKQFEKYALPSKHKDNGYTSHTPVTDGKHVFVMTGLGTVACYDLAGNRKWIKLLERPKHGYGHCASPMLVAGKLIVHIVDMVALDPTTGKEIWRTKSNANDVWGTPFHVKLDGTDLLFGANGDVVRVSDGKMLARRIAKLKYASPVVEDGVVYYVQNGGRALKLPETVGDKIECKQLWQIKIKKDRYYASAIVHDGLAYALTQKSVLVVLDAASGEVVYEKGLRLGGTAYPSIALAGKYLFVSSDTGVTVVIEPGREYKEVARNELEQFRSSPVFVGNRLYVRGYKNLYCIGS